MKEMVILDENNDSVLKLGKRNKKQENVDMKHATLVIMAAGIGSRYGNGIKQLAQVGPKGEIIIDYSIYDALEAGFDKVVFIIRREIEKEFKEAIGNRIEKITDVAYAYQELDDVPDGFESQVKERKKPWGTGQAILCCKDIVKEPFLVINADDYYGKEAYQKAYDYLTEERERSGKIDICMIGFVLKNTLSDNGSVTRGVCRVDENHMLTFIEETYGIEKKGEGAVAVKDGHEVELPLDSPVSMNMWGLRPEIFGVLQEGFGEFLRNLEAEGRKTEYLLPRIIGEMIEKGQARVKVLESKDRWFGVTYKEDKEAVEKSIRELIEAGAYGANLLS